MVSTREGKAIFYIVGTPIGNMGDISNRAVEILTKTNFIMCEDTRETKKLLNLLDISFQDKQLISVREQNEQSSCDKLISILNNGEDVVYMSDAGMPAISDPGARLVDSVHNAQLKINVVPGPSAVTSAVALSGFQSTSFKFLGFFPRKESEQLKEIKSISDAGFISVYFESPNRLINTLEVLSENLDTNQRVLIAREITKKFEESYRGTPQEALEHFENGIKGECVIVLEQNLEEALNAYDQNLENVMRLLVEKGLSSKDSIEVIKLLNSASKNDLKEIYNKIKR
jgi:16S rRNA (cytidine1402-2'-O)-methyltransferase